MIETIFERKSGYKNTKGQVSLTKEQEDKIAKLAQKRMKERLKK